MICNLEYEQNCDPVFVLIVNIYMISTFVLDISVKHLADVLAMFSFCGVKRCLAYSPIKKKRYTEMNLQLAGCHWTDQPGFFPV